MNIKEKHLDITLIVVFILLFIITILIYFSKPPLSDLYVKSDYFKLKLIFFIQINKNQIRI